MYPHPLALARLGFDTGRMLMQAQTVIALRMMGMAGLTRRAPGEDMRMITEKMQAAQASMAAAMVAGLRGGDATRIAQAALRPVGRATSANVRRLTRL